MAISSVGTVAGGTAIAAFDPSGTGAGPFIQAVALYTSVGTHTDVPGATSNTVILASNIQRRGATIYNDSTANLYIKLGTSASTTSFTVIIPGIGGSANIGGYYEVPFGYVGEIDGVWASATGNARVTELTGT